MQLLLEIILEKGEYEGTHDREAQEWGCGFRGEKESSASSNHAGKAREMEAGPESGSEWWECWTSGG